MNRYSAQEAIGRHVSMITVWHEGEIDTLLTRVGQVLQFRFVT